MLLLLLALVVLCRPPYFVSNMETFPDSAEYATMGLRLVREGGITLNIEGRELLFRYPPRFSVLFLAPVHVVSDSIPGNGIVLVTLSGLPGVVAGFLLGRRIARLAGGVLSSLFTVFLPDYYVCVRKIMIDVPAAVAGLWAALLYVNRT